MVEKNAFTFQVGDFVVLEKHLDAPSERLDGAVLISHQSVQVLQQKKWTKSNGSKLQGWHCLKQVLTCHGRGAVVQSVKHPVLRSLKISATVLA